MGDDVLESQQFIYQHPLTHVEFDASMVLDAFRNVFGVRDLNSQEDRDNSEDSPPAKRKQDSPAIQIAKKNTRAAKWKEMKRQRDSMLVLKTPQRT